MSRFSPGQARQIIAKARQASLGTLLESGAPYVSLVNMATSESGRPLLLLSKLAWHTQNLERNPKASLLVLGEAVAGDALAGARVSLVGEMRRVEGASHRASYLARHQEAEAYAGFADFGFFEMDVAEAHAIAGFGRIETLPGAALFGGSQASD